MLKCGSQMNFIFMFCLILQLKCGVLQENGSIMLPNISHEKLSSKLVDAFITSENEKCEPRPRTCYILQYLGHVICKKKYKLIPNISTGFELKESYTLTFTDTKYLPARAFFGICIHHLTLNDPDAVVDENVFEGTVRLVKYDVMRSSIKVIRLHSFPSLSLYIYITVLAYYPGPGVRSPNVVDNCQLFFDTNYVHSIHLTVLNA